MNEIGALGPMAHDVVKRVTAEGSRASGEHQADLTLEMYTCISQAFWKGMTSRFAHFARVNKDKSVHAPQHAAVRPPAGRQRPTGPLNTLLPLHVPASRAPARRAAAPARRRQTGAAAADARRAGGEPAPIGAAAAAAHFGTAPQPPPRVRLSCDPDEAVCANMDDETHSRLITPLIGVVVGAWDRFNDRVCSVRALAPRQFDSACARVQRAWQERGVTSDEIGRRRAHFEQCRGELLRSDQEAWLQLRGPLPAMEMDVGAEYDAKVAVFCFASRAVTMIAARRMTMTTATDHDAITLTVDCGSAAARSQHASIAAGAAAAGDPTDTATTTTNALAGGARAAAPPRDESATTIRGSMTGDAARAAPPVAAPGYASLEATTTATSSRPTTNGNIFADASLR